MNATGESIRVRATRLAVGTAGFSVFAAGSVTGWRYGRFLGTGSAALLALEAGRLNRAEALATDLLELAATFPDDWNYGNAIHTGHQILGHVRMRRGEPAAAERELLEAGRTPGSPQLNSFGPNLTLARDLLEAGRTESVVQYLELCRSFWCPENGPHDQTMNETRLNRWLEEIHSGEVPDFGPNLVY